MDEKILDPEQFLKINDFNNFFYTTAESEIVKFPKRSKGSLKTGIVSHKKNLTKKSLDCKDMKMSKN